MTIKIKSLLISTLMLVSMNIFGQNFKKKFQELSTTKDTLGQLVLLKEWENKNPNDPELYVSYFNFFVLKSRQEIIALTGGAGKSNKEGFQLTDSTGQVVGSMSPVVHFQDEDLNKGFAYIDKGIAAFPNRLDMRFSKTYILGQVENYKEFTTEIIKTIEYAQINKNAWLWSDNKPEKEAQKLMLSSIQDYIVQLFNTEDDDLMDNIQQISQTVLKYYPDHVESLSNVAVTFLMKKNYDKALEFLLKAEKLDPKDGIVLGNIAQTYKNKGDNKNTIKYYELMIKHGNSEEKERAKKKIAELKKK
jgi:tetratricopeptide (TPR) repeat protein